MAFLSPLGFQRESRFSLEPSSLSFAWRYPYIGLYLLFSRHRSLGSLSLFLRGIEIGERTFGGSIDVLVGELVAAAVLAAWAIRLFFFRREKGRDDSIPWLPLAIPYLVLVGAHVLSAFSSALPDPLLVLKYAVRPVLFVYVSSVILPVNFIRSRRRLLNAFLFMGLVGLFFAFDGIRSLFNLGEGFYRAHPLPILGFIPIGDNHNVLAELLLTTFPFVFAWGVLMKDTGHERWAAYVACLMMLIAVLTFARSAWITLLIQLIFLSVTLWRDWLKDHAKQVGRGIILAMPFIFYMMALSWVEGTGSTDARAMC